MKFPSDNEVDDSLYDYLRQINADGLHLDRDYSDNEMDDMLMWINNQGWQKVCPLNTTVEDPGYNQYAL